MNDWELCDKILLEQGLSQKDAFFRQTRTSGMLSANSSGVDNTSSGGNVERKRPPSHITHQSHITFRAIRVLTEHGLVTESSRKKSLLALFSHLQNEIDRVFQCRKNIIEKIQECMVEATSFEESTTEENDLYPSERVIESGNVNQVLIKQRKDILFRGS